MTNRRQKDDSGVKGIDLSPRQWTALSLLLPVAIAFIIRLVAYLELLKSPLRYYSSVGGLDMRGLLELGRWFYEGRGLFSVYSGLAALAMVFNGGKEWPEALIVLQYAGGCFLCFMIAWIALHLSGNRIYALFAGLFAAGYAPELMYESVTLRESVMVFVCTLSLFLILFWRIKHYSSWRSVAAGAVAAMPCLVRVSAGFWTALIMLWIWFYLIRRLKKAGKLTVKAVFIKGIIIGLGAFIMLLPAWSWNFFYQGYPLPFYLNIGYSLKAGSINDAESMNVDVSGSKNNGPGQKKNIQSCPVPSGEKTSKDNNCKVVCPFVKYGSKLVDVYMPFEKANNLNFYFIRDHFKVVGMLLRPELLLPLASLMLLWWLLRGDMGKYPGILMLYAVSFTVPLFVFLPLARYRLVLLPVFCLAGASLPVVEMWRMYVKRKNLNLLVCVITVVLTYFVMLPQNEPIRSEDYVAWGKAMQAGKRPVKQYVSFFEQGFLIDPESVSTAINLSGAYLRMRRYDDATNVCLISLLNNPDNQGLKLYVSTGFLASGKPRKAEEILRSVKTPTDPLGYYYNLGESLRLQGRNREALTCYVTALKSAKSSGQKRLLQSKIDKISIKNR